MYLLDTHALLWYLRDAPELPESVRDRIDCAEYVAVSMASFWEIAIKQSIGKLKLSLTIPALEGLCRDRNIAVLGIDAASIERIKSLPQVHSDPFDRLLVAQALENGLTIITRDRMIPQYPVPTCW